AAPAAASAALAAAPKVSRAVRRSRSEPAEGGGGSGPRTAGEAEDRRSRGGPRPPETNPTCTPPFVAIRRFRKSSRALLGAPSAFHLGEARDDAARDDLEHAMHELVPVLGVTAEREMALRALALRQLPTRGTHDAQHARCFHHREFVQAEA